SENFRIRFESDESPGPFGFTDDFKFLGRFAPFEFHVMDLSFAGNFDGKPFGDCIDALCAYAMRAAGISVATLPILSAGMQSGQNQFDARDFVLRVHVHWDTTAIVTN